MHRSDSVGGIVDRDSFRVVLVVTNEVADITIERGREQHRLGSAGAVPQNPLDLRCEPIVRHPVSLVEGHDLAFAESDLARLDQIDQPEWSRDHDLDALRQFVDLVMTRSATVNRQHGHAGMLCDRLEHLGDLYCELASWYQNEAERLGRLSGLGDPGKHRDTEGKGFSGSGLCSTAHVLARHRHGNRLSLDVEGRRKSARGEALINSGRNTKVGKAGWCLDRGKRVDRCEVRLVDVTAISRLVG